MRKQLSHYSLILGVTFLLTACGFQLRGTGDSGASLPDSWKKMHLVTASPNSEFSRAVIAQLAANGVEWTDRDQATFSLVLGPDRFQQRSLSLNSEARVAEYELTMTAQFSVLEADNKEFMEPTTVTVVKQMENDPRNVVGKEGEVRLIQNEMRSDLAEQILRRLSFYAASQAQSDSQPNAQSNAQSGEQPDTE